MLSLYETQLKIEDEENNYVVIKNFNYCLNVILSKCISYFFYVMFSYVFPYDNGKVKD